jgi:LPS-assembly protein
VLFRLDGSRMASTGTLRTQGQRKEMSHGVFSPCLPCKENPDRAPLWQIKAIEIIHDEVGQDLHYKDATMEFFGIPVFYSPRFSHPDPTAKRRDGLLIPRAGYNSDLGAVFSLPYYWAFGVDRDLVVEPFLFSNDGALIQGQYRQRFGKGEIDITASGGYLRRPDDSGRDEETFRGHVKALGRWDLNETWRSGFDLYRTTDRTYMRRYSLGNDDVLTSRAYAEGFMGRSYAIASSYGFQDLRADTPSGRTPQVLPLIEYHYMGEPARHGAYWTMDSSLMGLYRDQGQDSRRLSVITGWNLPYNSPGGHHYMLQATVQTDGYYYTSLEDPNVAGSSYDGTSGRFFPQLSLLWRYPLVRDDERWRHVIEPMAQVVISPNGSNSVRIPNEDSRSFEFDDTNLFRRNRFTGVDKVSSGTRVDYGINLSTFRRAGGSVRAFVGQSYRTRADSTYAQGSGLEDNFSDFVGRLVVSPGSFLDFVYRWRVDHENYTLRRSEVGTHFGPPRFRVGLDYIRLENSAQTGTDGRDQMSARLNTRIGDNWGLGIGTLRDLSEGGRTRLAGVSLSYNDECLIFSVDYSRRFVKDQDFDPGDTIFFRLVFKYLGELENRQGAGRRSS